MIFAPVTFKSFNGIPRSGSSDLTRTALGRSNCSSGIPARIRRSSRDGRGISISRLGKAQERFEEIAFEQMVFGFLRSIGDGGGGLDQRLGELLLLDESARFSSIQWGGTTQIGQRLLRAVGLADNLEGESRGHSDKKDEGDSGGEAGGLVPPQEKRELLPRARVFRAGGEAVLVGEHVGLQVLDARVTRGGVEGHRFAHHGEERGGDVWSAAAERSADAAFGGAGGARLALGKKRRAGAPARRSAPAKAASALRSAAALQSTSPRPTLVTISMALLPA